jgi:Uma2 family endonuclease
MEAIEQVPKTALDVFRLLPEGTLCEVIDNVLYMSPNPKYSHQRIVSLFARRIGDFLENNLLGEIIISPFDVYFDEHLSVVQPDLLIVLNANRGIIKEDGYIHGAPDMVIEVLSRDKKRDRVFKKQLYERAGVKEYIMVDPVNKKVVRLELQDSNYALTFEGKGLFSSSLLEFHFEF